MYVKSLISPVAPTSVCDPTACARRRRGRGRERRSAPEEAGGGAAQLRREGRGASRTLMRSTDL